MIMVSPITGKLPKIHPNSYIAPNATVIGDVTVSEGVNIWHGAIVRADVGPIFIGKNTSVQDNAVIHTDPDVPCEIGNHIVIGHSAVIHGRCQIEDYALIGINSTVLQDSQIGRGSIIGANAVVRGYIPAMVLAVGIPAQVKKTLTEARISEAIRHAEDYVSYGKKFAPSA